MFSHELFAYIDKQGAKNMDVSGCPSDKLEPSCASLKALLSYFVCQMKSSKMFLVVMDKIH